MERQVIQLHRSASFTRIGEPGRCMLGVMKKTPSPLESEFASAEEAAAYDRWFRTKVQASLADTRPNIAHDQVMAEMEAIIQAAESRLATKRS